MTNLITAKLSRVERDIAAEKGPLNLFAILEREDLTDRWDLVVSASWAKQDEPTLRYLSATIKRHLTATEMTLLARVVVLDAADEPVKTITANYEVEHGQVELDDPESFDLPARHGYIITSRRAA